MTVSNKVVIIVAMSENRVIGVDGEIPWHYPKDLERFQLFTSGNPLILGRKTHENIVELQGSPLPDRTHIVVTNSPNTDRFCDDVITAGSIDRAIAAGQQVCDSDTSPQCSAIYIAGGASIYEQTLDIADQIELTVIHSEYDGDAYFPELGDSWTETYRQSHENMDFVSLSREDRQTADGDSPSIRA